MMTKMDHSQLFNYLKKLILLKDLILTIFIKQIRKASINF